MYKFALLFLLLTHLLAAEILVTGTGTGLKIEIDGQFFTEYRNDRHVPCLYPLLSSDGTHLTRQYPFVKDVAGEQNDHSHHTGFWFAHGSVNGHDFWHGRNGEKIVTVRLHQETTRKDIADTSTRFIAVLDWRANDTKVLGEKRIYSITEEDGDRIIDVTCHLKATWGDVIFGDTKEGSCALRVAPTMRLSGEVAQGGIKNSNDIKGSSAWGKRAKWVAYHGPDSAGTSTVAAIFDHPDNLRHPTWWHARDYGLLTANPFGPKAYGDQSFQGKGDYTLKQGEVLTLKYRLLLHQGELGSANLDARWMEFAGQD